MQYLGALRRAAEKAADSTRSKQKVFLVPPGGMDMGQFFPKFPKKNRAGTMKNEVLIDFEDQHGELCNCFFSTGMVFEVQVLILEGQW